MCIRDRYGLYRLEKRYGGALLPAVHVVDMNEELRNGNTGVFSQALIEAIRQGLSCRRQSILLLNRRGYHTFASCKACGTVLTCPHCSISMTYHSANRRLMCHYCGYSVQMCIRDRGNAQGTRWEQGCLYRPCNAGISGESHSSYFIGRRQVIG